MQKIFSAISFFALLLVISLSACRNNASRTAAQKHKKVIEETARLDSLAQDLDEATKSIQEQARELEKALDTLE
ncbi:MAG: hypothetical protein AAFZ15_07945 [Bacteroidota bacterium]